MTVPYRAYIDEYLAAKRLVVSNVIAISTITVNPS